MKSSIIRFVIPTQIALLFVFFTAPTNAQQSGTLMDRFKASSKKNVASSSTTIRRPSTRSSSSSSSSSKPSFNFGKTPEQRAKEEAARRKTADARHKADLEARKKADAELDRLMAAYDRDRAKNKELKRKADEQRSREMVAKRKADDTRRRVLSEQRSRDIAAKKKADDARRKSIADKRIKDEQSRRLAAEQRLRDLEKQREAEDKARLQRQMDSELVDQAIGRERAPQTGGGFFSFGRQKTPPPRVSSVLDTAPETQVVASPPGRYLFIDEKVINDLNPSNSRIEIDVSDQRARVYNGSTLVIETQVSTGKPGYSTSPGYFSISEKLIDKKSGRYGTWYDSAGNKLKGDDSHAPPYGASKFVGADMPYWMRVNGGIGMHIGYVPDGPASHGCIRVPSNVQPLIFSKVKVGTSVRIKY